VDNKRISSAHTPPDPTKLNDCLLSNMKPDIYNSINEKNVKLWEEQVFDHSCCVNYRILKDQLSFEPYLRLLNDRQRIIFTKFRCGNNKLPVNVNKFTGTDVDKLCTICEAGDIGDEFHYIMSCSALKDERARYLDRPFYEKPNTLKLKILFQTNNLVILKNLIKFISVILSKVNPK
jgi:hypothetical protein